MSQNLLLKAPIHVKVLLALAVLAIVCGFAFIALAIAYSFSDQALSASFLCYSISLFFAGEILVLTFFITGLIWRERDDNDELSHEEIEDRLVANAETILKGSKVGCDGSPVMTIPEVMNYGNEKRDEISDASDAIDPGQYEWNRIWNPPKQ